MKMGQRIISVFLLFVLADIFGNVVVCQVSESNTTSCVDGPGPVYFRIYSSSDPNGTLYDMNSENITLDTGKQICLIASGFKATPYSKVWQILVACLVNKYNMIVIIIDWRIGACTCDGSSTDPLSQYAAAANNIKAVGKLVAEFFMRLITYGADPKTTTLIGHSLGVHLFGVFCKYLLNLPLELIGSFFALDGAGPGFQQESCDYRACSTDATLFTALHTSSVLGMSREYGKIDLYVNGGVNQPGCSNVTNLTDLTNSAAMCPHVHAIHYFIHAICGPNCTYIGKKLDITINPLPPISGCSKDTCVTLRLQMGSQPEGTYYIDTTKMTTDCGSSLYAPIPLLFGSTTNCTTP